MAWFALGRLAGVIGFLVLVVVLLLGAASGSVAWMAVGAVGGAAAVWLAVRADSEMQRRRARRVAQMAQPAAYAQPDFEANLNAWKLGLYLALLVVLALICLLATDIGSLEAVVVFLALSPLVVLGSVALLVTLACRRQAGWVLRFDHQGIHSCALPVLPWRHVLGIDLRAMEVKGQVHATLFLAVDAAWMAGLAWSWRKKLCLWTLARLHAERQMVELSLEWVDAEPRQILSAAVALADRHGAPRVDDWSYWLPLDLAREHAEVRTRLRESMAENDRWLAQARAELSQAGYRGSLP